MEPVRPLLGFLSIIDRGRLATHATFNSDLNKLVEFVYTKMHSLSLFIHMRAQDEQDFFFFLKIQNQNMHVVVL